MDAETFKKVCLPYSGNFYRVAYRLLEDSQDAEDVVQDVFEKLWKARNSLSNIQSIEAYGVTITRNLCLDRLKSMGHKIVKCDPQESLKYETEDVSERETKRDQVKTIKTIVNELPEKQQQVFYLRYFKDCTSEEIEKITGIGAGNIRVLLTRARQTVKEQINKRSKYETTR